jgi:hypothetical protein
LQTTLDAALSVSTPEIAEAAVAQGKKAAQIGQAIAAARVRAMEGALSKVVPEKLVFLKFPAQANAR